MEVGNLINEQQRGVLKKLCIGINIDMDEIDDGGLRFSEENYYHQLSSDGEDSENENVGEDLENIGDDETNMGEKGDCENEKKGWRQKSMEKNMKMLRLEDVKNIGFTSVEEAEQLYSYYSVIVGFSTKRSHLRTNKEKELKSQKLRRILFARGILLQLGFPFHHGDLVSTWKPLSNRKSCFYKESKKKKSNPNPTRRACCRANKSPIHGLLGRFWSP
ncbi:hypothetical protein ACLB2K_041446 [Fragaria x ananassa]